MSEDWIDFRVFSIGGYPEIYAPVGGTKYQPTILIVHQTLHEQYASV